MVFDRDKKDGNANVKFRKPKKNRKKIRENFRRLPEENLNLEKSVN